MLGRIYHNGQLGQIYIQKAINHYLIAYNIDPLNHEYTYNLARAYLFERDYRNAEPFLKQCVDTTKLNNEERGLCANRLGHAYKTHLNFKKEEAFKYLKMATEIDQDHPVYKYDLAIAYYKAKNYLEAATYLELCLNEPTNLIYNFSNRHRAECASELGVIHYQGKLAKKLLIKQFNIVISHINLIQKILLISIFYLYLII